MTTQASKASKVVHDSSHVGHLSLRGTATVCGALLTSPMHRATRRVLRICSVANASTDVLVDNMDICSSLATCKAADNVPWMTPRIRAVWPKRCATRRFLRSWSMRVRAVLRRFRADRKVSRIQENQCQKALSKLSENEHETIHDVEKGGLRLAQGLASNFRAQCHSSLNRGFAGHISRSSA